MSTNIRTGILLAVVFVWGCGSRIVPTRVEIHWSSFTGSHNAAWSCEVLMELESVTVTDAGAVSKLWDLSYDTGIFTKSDEDGIDHVICVVFYAQNGSTLRRVGLSLAPVMMIDSTVYRRDIPLFKAIVEHLPEDYLRQTATELGLSVDTTDTMYFYFDPQDDIMRNSEGKDQWEVLFGDSTRIPASKITGRASDTGYYYRLPAAELTGDSTDTGYYISFPLKLSARDTTDTRYYLNPISKIIRDADGNIITP